MRNTIAIFAAALCFCLSSCRRPVAYFQPTPHVSARSPLNNPPSPLSQPAPDSGHNVAADPVPDTEQATASLAAQPVLTDPTAIRVERRLHHLRSLLPSETLDRQPGPKPKKQLRLGNRIRQSLGMPLRKELNWWQRISWKLKASVIVILVAVVFAILHISLLAIIFGLLGAFLLISGLRRSFKVRRPWF